MIRNKDLLPEIYSDSYDFSIFTGILDLIYNGRNVDLHLLRGNRSPKYCPTANLTRLSLFHDIQTNNRDLIANYRFLIKQKGTRRSIELLAELCGATKVRIETEENSQKINLYFISKNFNSNLFYYIGKRIFPINTLITLIPKLSL